MSTNASRKIATRWLSFYTYAYLPFTILFSFAPLLAQYDRLVELGYKVKLNPLMFVPIVVSGIFICFLIYGLHKKKFWGWVCNWIFLGAKVLLSPVYSTMSFGFGAYLVTVILLFLIFFLPNFIYFKKRRFLFEGSKEPKNTPNSFSQKELEWISAHMQRGYEKHNVTPKREVANFMRLPSQATLDYAAEFEPRVYDIANKAIEAMGRTGKLSKTTDLKTPAGQIESISPDAVRAEGEKGGVSTEPSAKPPDTATEASPNIYRKEVVVSIKVALAMIASTGAIIMIGIIFFFVTTKNNNSNQGTLVTLEQFNDNTANQDYLYPEDRPASSPTQDYLYPEDRPASSPTSATPTALAHTKRGNDFLKTGKYAGAIDAYNTALRINPRYAIAYYNRSVAHVKTGQYEKAITDCSKVIELDPNMANAYYNRGFSYWYLGHKQLSVKDFILAARFGNNEAEEFLNSRGIKW